MIANSWSHPVVVRRNRSSRHGDNVRPRPPPGDTQLIECTGVKTEHVGRVVGE